MYLQRGIKELAEVVMPTIINNQHLIGVQGELGRKFGPLAELVEQAANDGEFDKRYQTMVKDIINNEFGEFTVFDSNGTINFNGEMVPVFIRNNTWINVGKRQAANGTYVSRRFT